MILLRLVKLLIDYTGFVCKVFARLFGIISQGWVKLATKADCLVARIDSKLAPKIAKVEAEIKAEEGNKTGQ